MADSALYFPHIEVPRSATLTRVLLYWDTLGSIVPSGVPWSETMQQLVDLDLVAPVDPLDYISYRGGWPSHRRDLERLLDECAKLGSEYRPGLDGRPTIHIHIDKFDKDTWRLLGRYGFARFPSRTEYRYFGEWVEVEQRVGLTYLALLAMWLGQRCSMDPITDRPESWAILGQDARSAVSLTLDRMRGALLRNILPAPSHPIDPTELAAFKTEHSTLLRSLRRRVETELLRCASEQDPEARARLLALAQAGLEDEAEEVRRRMRERKWPSVQEATCAVLQGIPGVVAGAAAGKPALSATGAVPLAVEIIRQRFGTANLGTPIAYAVLAEDRFG